MDGAFDQEVSFPLLSVSLVWPPILLLTPPALGQHLPPPPPPTPLANIQGENSPMGDGDL